MWGRAAEAAELLLASVCTSALSLKPKKEWEIAWKGVVRSVGSYLSIFVIRSCAGRGRNRPMSRQ